MTVGVDAEGRATSSAEELAEYEQERPARRLRAALNPVVSVWCAMISVGVLAQVFFRLPQGTRFYLVIFLAAILPITLLCYRGFPCSRDPDLAPVTITAGICLLLVAVVGEEGDRRLAVTTCWVPGGVATVPAHGPSSLAHQAQRGRTQAGSHNQAQ